MAVKNLIDRLHAGGLADASTYPRIRAEQEARQHAHHAAVGLTQTAAQVAALARDKHHESGGKYAAFRGKKLAPVLGVPGQRTANGMAFDGHAASDVLSEAIDD